MQKRMLGKSGLEVLALGFRWIGISFGSGPATAPQEGLACLRSVRERGDRRRGATFGARSGDGRDQVLLQVRERQAGGDAGTAA
jgi:hypothetical protein